MAMLFKGTDILYPDLIGDLLLERMALIFQYGSNLSVSRLNHADRLNGDAELVAVAQTVEHFELRFSVWSVTNNCAAADIVPNSSGRSIYGVLYSVPDHLLSRFSFKSARRSIF